MKHINNKGLSNLIIISISFIIISIFSTLTYLYFSRNKLNQNTAQPSQVTNLTNSTKQSITKYKTDIVFQPSDSFEDLRQRVNPDRIEIMDNIENDLYSKWEKFNTDSEDKFFKDYKIFKYRLISIRYKKNINYEVALTSRIVYVAKDEKSVAIPNGSGAECLHSKSTKPNSKWELIKCYQNPVDCKDLDKLGFNYKQTVEWGCFDYEKQIERK